MDFPPNIEIDEDDFRRAWAKLVLKIMQKGMVIPTEYGNMSKDACTRVTLTGKAIDQILKRDVHPQEPFGKTRIEEYMQQYTREYDWRAQGFEYTYMERFMDYHGIDQLAAIKEKLGGGVTRRAQMITWMPERDLGREHPPCLQRIWIRPLTDTTCEVHLSWRSRDAYGAWSSNLCGIIDMLYREILKPNNLRIVKLVDFCSSAHIYDSDWDAANRVRLA
jgi:thymidylate synthase